MTFPKAFVQPIMDSMERNLPGNIVVPRSLSAHEVSDTIGVYPGTWRPVEDSDEIGRGVSGEPTLNVYSIKIQNLRINADLDFGNEPHLVTSRKIRAILYRDTALHVALASLSDEFMGTVERFQRMEVIKQDYLSANTGMGLYLLCTTEIVFTTETTPVS